MRTKTLGAWIAAVMTIIGLTVTGTALFTITQVGDIEETWRTFDKGTATKIALLSELRGAMGYGGMIHDFKNFVLRMEHSRIAQIEAEINDSRAALAAYGAVGVNHREETALKALGVVIALYADSLAVAERMAGEGRTSAEIDQAVKVDDAAALDAMAVLDAELRKTLRATSAAVYDSVTSVTLLMKSALAVSLVILIVLIVGFSRYMKSRAERNQAVRDLAKKTAILEATLNNVDQGISFTDTDLNLVAFNQRFLELLNFPLDRFEPGDPFESFIRYNAERGEYGPGDVDEQVRERVELAKKFEPHHFERERPDGTVLEIHGNALPHGQGFVTTYSDITERKRAVLAATEARDAAEAANRSKSEFLANMSHELRTPLNAVIGFSDMMKNELMGPIGNPQYLSYAADIHSSGEHLLGLINDILDLSKIEAGEMTLNEDVLDLNEMVRSSLKLVKPRADGGGVNLVNSTPGEPRLFLGEPRKIKQILLNLLSNAVKFTPEGGTVSIGTRGNDDGGISIIVTDNGIGISDEDIEQVMKPFVQADSALSRNYEGTGLGLPLTKALVELHGGRLELSSELGVGTEAAVHFPPDRTVDQDGERDMSGAA